MADMGAEVIKVEPLTGDGMRGKLRQPSAPEGVAVHDVPFQLDNRGKRSVAVDLTSEAGAALVREMATGVDVVVTNLLPARLARYGLAPDARAGAANPRLVYALVTGYGSVGPDADRAAFDLTAFFGRAGIMSLVGEPGAPPPAFRPGQGDHTTGLALLVGVLAALRHRDRTGEGQVVETALLQTGAWTIGCDVQVALVDRAQPTKRARADSFSPLNTRYRCADDVWINLSAHSVGLWPAFCAAVDRPDLAADERFATPAGRYRHRGEVDRLLDAVRRGAGRPLGPAARRCRHRVGAGGGVARPGRRPAGARHRHVRRGRPPRGRHGSRRWRRLLQHEPFRGGRARPGAALGGTPTRCWRRVRRRRHRGRRASARLGVIAGET